MVTGDRAKGSGRGLVAVGTAAAILAPVALTLPSTGPASAAPSNDNPNGVLKYGFDLNNEFSNSFDPDVGSTTVRTPSPRTSTQSVTAPGQLAISGGVAQSWTVSNNSSTITLHIRPDMVFSNGTPVTSHRRRGQPDHTKTSPLRSSLTAIATMSTPMPKRWWSS